MSSPLRKADIQEPMTPHVRNQSKGMELYEPYSCDVTEDQNGIDHNIGKETTSDTKNVVSCSDSDIEQVRKEKSEDILSKLKQLKIKTADPLKTPVKDKENTEEHKVEDVKEEVETNLKDAILNLFSWGSKVDTKKSATKSNPQSPKPLKPKVIKIEAEKKQSTTPKVGGPNLFHNRSNSEQVNNQMFKLKNNMTQKEISDIKVTAHGNVMKGQISKEEMAELKKGIMSKKDLYRKHRANRNRIREQRKSIMNGFTKLDVPEIEITNSEIDKKRYTLSFGCCDKLKLIGSPQRNSKLLGSPNNMRSPSRRDGGFPELSPRRSPRQHRKTLSTLNHHS